MANSIDTLIKNATARAVNAVEAVYKAQADMERLSNEIKTALINTDSPEFIVDESVLPTFEQVAVSPTTDITFKDASTKMPDSPKLKDVSTNGVLVAAAGIPKNAPSINIDNLFQHELPSTTIPNFDVDYPSINIDALVAEMNAIAAPILKEYEFPEISDLMIGDVPELNIPEYVQGKRPEDIGDPEDYRQILESSYNNYLPEMQTFVDEKVNVWQQTYAPEYDEQRSLLHEKIVSGLNGQALPDEYEQALYNRALSRTDKEFRAATAGITETKSRAGFLNPPGSIVSSLNKLRIAAAEANSNQSTEVYIKKSDQELQFLQFIISTTGQIVQSVRGLAIQSASIYLSTIQNSISLSNSVAEKVALVFDHQVKRSELMISVMDALQREFDSRLRAALSGLEGYKLELEAAKARTDVDIARVGIIEAQIAADGRNVALYSALIDSVVKKGNLEELKLREYSEKGEIYKTEIQAQLASFDVFQSAMRGDESKLKGELSKLETFSVEVDAGRANVNAQAEAIKAEVSVNSDLLDEYSTGASVYKTDVDAAISKFSTEAQVIKVGQQLYSDNLSGEIDVYKINNDEATTRIETSLKAFVANTSTFLKQMDINLKAYQMIESGTSSSLNGLAGVAAAANNSLNTMISKAEASE